MYLYLVFSKTGTWLSKLLRFFVETKYVHASISLEEDLNTMYSFGRVHPNNPFFGGFVLESFRGGVYTKYPDCECIVYRIKITEQQHATLVNEISGFLASRKLFKYNFLGLFAAALNIPLKRKKHYFCSQFVSELLIKIDVLNSQNEPELIRPTDLLEIEPKEQVFKGYTWQYRALANQNLAFS
ncbi:MAG: hypothetical protein ACOX2P_07170 [Bacillota bacterium]|jgi:hypothetical protein